METPLGAVGQPGFRETGRAIEPESRRKPVKNYRRQAVSTVVGRARHGVLPASAQASLQAPHRKVGSLCMPGLSVKQIHQVIHQLILQHPGGIRFAELCKQIKQANLQTPDTTIKAALVAFNKQLPSDLTKPSRGLFAPAVSDGTMTAGGTSATAGSSPAVPSLLSEDRSYQPFADYLVTELGEVVAAEGLVVRHGRTEGCILRSVTSEMPNGMP